MTGCSRPKLSLSCKSRNFRSLSFLCCFETDTIVDDAEGLAAGSYEIERALTWEIVCDPFDDPGRQLVELYRGGS